MITPLNGYELTERPPCSLAVVIATGSKVHSLDITTSREESIDIGCDVFDVTFDERASTLLLSAGRRGVYRCRYESHGLQRPPNDSTSAVNDRLAGYIATQILASDDVNRYWVRAINPKSKIVSIWRYDSITSECVKLIDDCNVSLLMCPGGNRAVEYKTTDVGYVRLFELDKRSSRLVKIADDSILHATISSSGDRMGFSVASDNGAHSFFEYIFKTSARLPLGRGTCGGYAPLSGKWAVIRGEQELLVAGNEGDNLLAIAAVPDVVSEGELHRFILISPKWCKDGRWILATLRERRRGDLSFEGSYGFRTIVADTLLRTITILPRSSERVCWGAATL